MNSLEEHAPSCPKIMGADSADALQKKNRETAAHARLKRLALSWAQRNGYSACALEVSLPRCRYRADVAAYRPIKSSSSSLSSFSKSDIGTTAVFECKQCLVDLRRDNSSTAVTMLRVHYPALQVHDSLFVEFDSHNFEAIDHRGYKQVLRQTLALQNRLFDCTKFETLIRYRCANLFFLVLPQELFREPEIPIGWGALIESSGELILARKPLWHDTAPEHNLRVLERIARAGTRALNRQLGIVFEDGTGTV